MSDRRASTELSTAKKIVFALIPVLVLLVAAEVVLRFTGLAERCSLPYRDSPLWACDPILVFRLKPWLSPGGKLLNHAGFRTHEFEPKKPGVYRILVLGDSTTFGMIAAPTFEYIDEPYPERLERLVAERNGPGKVEVLNAGVAGYNSYHGVMLLRTRLRGLHPDLITVRFGWNDHFMSAGGHSREMLHEPRTRWGLMAEDLLLHTELYPFVRRLSMEATALVNGPHKPSLADVPKAWLPDISLEDYKHNLRRMVELGHQRGADVWLLTSPTAFVTDENAGQYDKFPATQSAKLLILFNAIPTFARLIEIHDQYNAATREVGAELGVRVVDMDRVYREHSSEHLFTGYDIVHPTDEGHELEAETLYENLVEAGVLPRAATTQTARPASS